MTAAHARKKLDPLCCVFLNELGHFWGQTWSEAEEQENSYASELILRSRDHSESESIVAVQRLQRYSDPRQVEVKCVLRSLPIYFADRDGGVSQRVNRVAVRTILIGS